MLFKYRVSQGYYLQHTFLTYNFRIGYYCSIQRSDDVKEGRGPETEPPIRKSRYFPSPPPPHTLLHNKSFHLIPNLKQLINITYRIINFTLPKSGPTNCRQKDEILSLRQVSCIGIQLHIILEFGGYYLFKGTNTWINLS